MSKPGIVSKATSGIALLIGLSPVIQQAQNTLLKGDAQGFGKNLADIYSAGLTQGSFRWDLALEGYGPLIGAVVFKKAMSYLLRHAKLKF